MISDATIAKSISDLMLEIGGRLNDSVAEIRAKCSYEEFAIYRKAVGVIMAEILLQILNPLYSRHPSLRPPGFE